MTNVMKQIKQRNWVAKNNRHKSARHRDPTQYRRNEKHRIDYANETGNEKK